MAEVKVVTADVIQGIVDRYVEGQSRPEDRGAFIASEGDCWVAVDNTTGDCWVEEFKTEAKARAYAERSAN